MTGNLAENFGRFKQAFKIDVVASGIDNKSERIKANVLLDIIGTEAVEIYNSFVWGEGENKENFSDILTKFENYCNPKKNVTFEWTEPRVSL